ncbi:MAG TPA: hypothetical protein VLA13_04710 [Massilibacterium sp.]|nr:hypothetical protein [Massilibacterium sp.]
MNAIELPKTHYFWILPEEDIKTELRITQNILGDNPCLLVSWETYTELRNAYQEEMAWREAPDYNCLDMFILKTETGKVTIAVTR